MSWPIVRDGDGFELDLEEARSRLVATQTAHELAAAERAGRTVQRRARKDLAPTRFRDPDGFSVEIW